LSESPPTNEPNEEWKSTVVAAALTDVGMRRATNQDSMTVMLAESKSMWEKYGHVFIVADGMGAHAAGELASQLAVELIPHHFLKLRDIPPAEALHKAITESNAEIYRRGQANIEFRSMGTTCSLLALLPEGAVVAHVGDSRVYQLRGNMLFQLTFDHSLVWEMQAAGEVTDETARSGVIPKNVITRSLGPNPHVQIDLEGPFPLKVGDRFLLCSDGLSGQLKDEEIGVLLRALPPSQAGQILIDLSNLRGGPDNITAIVIEVAKPAIASAQSGSIVPRRQGPRRSFSPALGVITAVCVLAALVMLLASNIALAIILCVLGAIALATGLAQVYWPAEETIDLSSRYGNGPYRQYSAEADADLFEHLVGVMKSLREAAEERQWKIAWTKLDERFRTALKLADSGQKSEAVRTQAEIIIDLFAQIKKQRERQASDSAIEL
jgi:PPM family protein phosphatase